MAFVLVKAQKRTDRDTRPFAVEFDPKNPDNPPAMGADLQSLTFNLCAFVGADSLRFSDMMMVTEGEVQKLKAGTVAREKCMRATVSIDGMDDDEGAPITELTRDIYAQLPTWILNRLLLEVNRRNAEDETDTGN